MENNQLNNSDFLDEGQGKNSASIDKTSKTNGIIPDFSDLDSPNGTLKDPNTYKGEFDELGRRSEALARAQNNPFPIEVFPEAIQRIILETHRVLRYPMDFTASGILYAASVAIGNKRRLRFKTDWTEPSILYMAIVGNRGTNKTHPLTFVLKPLNDYDKRNFKVFKQMKEEFDKFEGLPSKAKKEAEMPPRPVWKQKLVTDFTEEALRYVLMNNPDGIGVYRDELAGWFENFAKYNKGNEEQFWLSVWNGNSHRVNRVTSDPVFIDHLFISVIGTIQPGVLIRLAEGRVENGFMDRILYAFVKGLKMEPVDDSVLPDETTEVWRVVLNKLLDLEPVFDHGELRPEMISLTKEARTFFIEWSQELTTRVNEADDTHLSGIAAKMTSYMLRFALILEYLQYGCNNSDAKYVSLQSISAAERLVEYFTRTSLMVASVVNDCNPLELMTDKQVKFYHLLPDQFKTSVAVQIGVKKVEISDTTARRWIKDESLYAKESHGIYKKKSI